MTETDFPADSNSAVLRADTDTDNLRELAKKGVQNLKQNSPEKYKILAGLAKLKNYLDLNDNQLVKVFELFPDVFSELPMPQNPRVNLAINIKKYRLKYQLTRANLAEMIGVSTNVLGQYERGERGASIETVCKLADIFAVSTDELLGRVSFTPENTTQN